MTNISEGHSVPRRLPKKIREKVVVIFGIGETFWMFPTTSHDKFQETLNDIELFEDFEGLAQSSVLPLF